MPLQYPSTSFAQPSWGVASSGIGRTPAGGTYLTGAPIQQQSDPLTNSYKTYDAAVGQQAKDYDSIMGKYNDYYNKLSTSATPGYTQSSDSAASLAKLRELSDTGGYSAGDINALRERGISPIRSVYASANRDVDRQRVLQGGFSPNYNAVKSKMAREMSNQIADQMNDVNAGIAERQAGNRLSAAVAYGSNAQSENELRNRYTFQGEQLQGDALRGMTSLYGTTPALAQLFGSQALQGAGLQNDINQGNQRNNLALISSMISGMR